MSTLKQLWERRPVVLAPMAGVSSPRLVAAAVSSRILGFHGAAFKTPQALGEDIDAIRELSGKSENALFGVNLFALYEYESESEDLRAREAAARKNLEPLYNRMNLEMPAGPAKLDSPKLEEQLKIVLEKKVPVFSFCFGRLRADDILRLQQNGTVVVGTATSVAEAELLESDGVDAIIAQGAEAGGHRASFLPDSSLVGTLSLVPQIVDRVKIPVLAAGGIADARGVAAAQCLGAEAGCIGTAFLTSSDSEADKVHKECIMSSAETETVCTDIFSGRSARGLINEYVLGYDQGLALGNHNKARVMDQCSNVAPYPVQQSLTNPLKKASVERGGPHLRSMWSGQSTRLCTGDSVETIVDRIEKALAKTS